MTRLRNPEDYYDQYFERKRANMWWRIVLRYIATLVAFLLLVIVVLSAWWIWEDYSARGLQGITWENFSHRAVYRWNEFKHGRLGLDQVFCTNTSC